MTGVGRNTNREFTGCDSFHQIVDFLNICHIKYALIENPTIYVSLIEQFWQTATACTLENEDMEITATIDRKVKIVSESSIRRHLKQKRLLLPYQRTYMAPSLTQKLFRNMKRTSNGYTRVDTPFFQTMLVLGQILQGEGSTIPETKVPQPSSPTQTYVADEAATIGGDDKHRGAAITVSGLEAGQEYHIPTPHDSPLHVVHSHRSEEGSLKLQELMNLVTTLSDRIGVLEANLLKTKKTYSSAYTKLILRVKKLESQIKIGKARKQTRVVISDDEAFEDDSSKQGRKLFDEEAQEKASSDTELFIQEVTPTEVIQDQEGSGKASDEV
ncbi:hypothetical protein Tco_1519130, partial [Tanacetum coccineum]